MQQAFLILPILYFGAVLAVTAIIVVALWRIMRAQEATAVALERIAQAVARLRPPS